MASVTPSFSSAVDETDVQGRWHQPATVTSHCMTGLDSTLQFSFMEGNRAPVTQPLVVPNPWYHGMLMQEVSDPYGLTVSDSLFSLSWQTDYQGVNQNEFASGSSNSRVRESQSSGYTQWLSVLPSVIQNPPASSEQSSRFHTAVPPAENDQRSMQRSPISTAFLATEGRDAFSKCGDGYLSFSTPPPPYCAATVGEMFGNTVDTDNSPTPALSSTVRVSPSSIVPQAWILLRHSTRPSVSWVPDCPTTLQDTFNPPGILWASTYECRWIGCGEIVDRGTFPTCEAYLQSVYEHFGAHAKAISEGRKRNGCGWEGCSLKTKSSQGLKSKRDKMRHIVTHLPWYTLCTRCVKLSARRDARGTKNTCVSGKCWPSADLALRAQVANEENGLSGAEIRVDRFCEIVFG